MHGRDHDPPFIPTPRACRQLACGLLLLALPAAAQTLPGVRILSSGEDGSGESSARLVVGDTGQPPGSGSACLAWTWKEPDAEIEVYPAAEAGSFIGVEQTWSVGAAVPSQACQPAGLPAFPEIAVGPADELWFLGSGAGDAWADLLHAVEAAYRQSSPLGEAPLGALSVGTFGQCEIHSVPVDLRTRLDRWLPVELPGDFRVDSEDAAHELVRVRRFLWWIEPGCATAGEELTLNLFPFPEDEAEGHLLTVDGVTLTSPNALELDAESWSPRLRHHAPLETAGDVFLEPTPEQREQLPVDLCAIRGLDQLCNAHTKIRRRLYTAITDPQAEAPWPAERVRTVQAACEKVLTGRTAVDSCSTRGLWGAVASEAVAGFRGELVVSDEPRIIETWHDDPKGGKVTWRLEDPSGLTEVAELQIGLLDGASVTIDTSGFQAPKTWSRGLVSMSTWIFPAFSLSAFILSLAAFFRARPAPARPSRPELMRVIEAAVDRRLDQRRAMSSGAASGQDLDVVVDEATRQLEEHAAELLADFDRHVQVLRNPPVFEVVEEERFSDPDPAFLDGLEAMSQLGYWIELLWPVLQEASGSFLEAIASRLPEPAAEEWRRARKTLETFSTRDAVAARQILGSLKINASSNNGKEPRDPALDAFLETSGLADTASPLPERLKRYLEPFDHTGRLGEVTLALQYLLEAYPVEQLEPERRAMLRRGMAEAAGSIRLSGSFHDLVGRIAAGVGLDYRAVSYYKSRIDQSDYAFVRQQVSPISLTERVGFAAATDPSVVVRLERPFFFQSANNVYYAGHAHVARG